MPDRIDAIMQTDFRALSPETPIREAIAALVDGAVSAAPVVDADGHLVGILTQRDCFGPALNASYYQQWTGKVGDSRRRGHVFCHHPTCVQVLAPGRNRPACRARGVMAESLRRRAEERRRDQ